MEFLSIPFVCCMAVTFLLYYLRQERCWQHAVLLVASMVFIGYYHPIYLLTASAFTVFTFLWGRLIHKTLDSRAGTVCFWLGIVALVGFWLVARYWFPLFPLGISFYTFQALSYLIEIYWEEDPEDAFIDFTLYMMFFVKFLSGPIERACDLLPQLKTARTFDYTLVTRGLKLVVWGVFLKVVIADRISPSLDIVLNDVHDATGMQLLVATMLYPIQLYSDFAGYTCMALGLGRMLGFRLHPNFDRPFASRSTGELWRRWHESLSFWVRDYVFTPLNASLREYSRWGVYLSLLVTFVVIGVWHGAGWTFACYGLCQGILVIEETLLGKRRERWYGYLGKHVGNALMMVRTYIFFALSLLFFRVAKVSDVFYTYRHLFDGIESSVKELRLGMDDHSWIVFGVATVVMLIVEYANSHSNLIVASERLRPLWRWTLYFAVLLIILFYGSFGVENFIYIQF